MKKEFNLFIEQFRKINLIYLYTLLIDAIFAGLTYVAVMLWAVVLSNQASNVPDLQNLQQSMAEQATTQMSGTIFTVFFSTIVVILAIWIMFSVSQGLIWNMIYSKKSDKKFFVKFSLLNVICLPLEIVILIAVFFILSKITSSLITLISPVITATFIQAIVALIFGFLILGPIFLYAANIANLIFIKFVHEHKVFKSIKDGFILLIKKGAKLYIPFVLASIAFYLLSAVLLIFSLVSVLYNILAIIFILAFITWMRFYIKDILKE